MATACLLLKLDVVLLQLPREYLEVLTPPTALVKSSFVTAVRSLPFNVRTYRDLSAV